MDLLIKCSLAAAPERLCDEVDIFRFEYYRLIYGEAVKKSHGGLIIDEVLSIENKVEINNNKWKAVLDDVATLEVDTPHIPYWYDLPNINDISTESELPCFSGLGDRRIIKINIRNDNLLAGVREHTLWGYLRHRASEELVPNYIGDYHYQLYILKMLFRAIFKRECILFPLLKRWMLVFGMDGTHYTNIIRLNEGKLQAIGADSHFLKRVSVIINTITNAISNTTYIAEVPRYLDVLEELGNFMFRDPISGVRKIKSIHTVFHLNNGLYPLDSTFIKRYVDHTSYAPSVSAKHYHPKFNCDEINFNKTYLFYPPSKICLGCSKNLIQQVNIKRFTAEFEKAYIEAKALHLDNFSIFSMYVLLDYSNAQNLRNQHAYNIIMAMAGFTQTNKFLDVAKSVETTKKHSDEFHKKYVHDGPSEARKMFECNISQMMDNIYKICMDRNLFPSPKQYRNSVLSYMTGKSAGIGSYTASLLINGKKESLKFTDKRFITLAQGQDILNIDSLSLKTESLTQWRSRIHDSNQKMFNDLLRNKDPSPNSPEFGAFKIRQAQIGIRAVPGGKSIRAIYIQSLPVYMLENLCYTFVDAFMRPAFSDVVHDKFPNSVDLGNVNIKYLNDNTDTPVNSLVMFSSDSSMGIYFMDFSSYDLSETHEYFLKYKYRALKKLCLMYEAFYDREKYYIIIDGVRCSLYDVVNHLESISEGQYFTLADAYTVMTYFISSMRSGSKDTFDWNSITNSAVTKTIEMILAIKNLITKLRGVRIAGDDNGGGFKAIGMSESQLEEAIEVFLNVPTEIGLIVNKFKSGISTMSCEMAKISASYGYVLNLGATQYFESEKESQAMTIVEKLRGFTNKSMLFNQRHLGEQHIMRLLSILTASGSYVIRTEKKGSGLSRTRTSFIPPSAMCLMPASSPLGLGISFSGVATNEAMFLANISHEWFIRHLLYSHKFTSVLTNIYEEPFIQALNTHITSARGSERSIHVTDNFGIPIIQPFINAKHMLHPDDAALQSSKTSYNDLLRRGISIDRSACYFESTNQYLIDSIKSAVSKKATKYFEVMKSLRNLPISGPSGLELARCKAFFRQTYPVLATLRFLFIQRSFHTQHPTRYITGLERLIKLRQYVGDVHDTAPQSSTTNLRVFRDCINAAKRNARVNTKITEEGFRDIIIKARAKKSSANTIDTIVRGVIVSLFGSFPDMEKHVSSISRNASELHDESLGFSMGGSSITTLDYSKRNMQRFIEYNNTGLPQNLANQIGMAMLSSIYIVYGVTGMINLQSTSPEETRILSHAWLKHAAESTQVMLPSSMSGL